jgi:hypothetical protein
VHVHVHVYGREQIDEKSWDTPQFLVPRGRSPPHIFANARLRRRDANARLRRRDANARLRRRDGVHEIATEAFGAWTSRTSAR